MSTNDEKVRMKLRRTEEEKAEVEHDAAICGLSQTEYICQLCLGKKPRLKPSSSAFGTPQTGFAGSMGYLSLSTAGKPPAALSGRMNKTAKQYKRRTS